MGRPPIEIDGKLVEKMASWGAKTQEIADHFGVSDDTISRRFAAELIKGRSDVRMSLRQWQLSVAKKGNPTMLIWLGKQMLGQQDKTEIQLTKIPDEVFLEEAQRRLKITDGSKE